MKNINNKIKNNNDLILKKGNRVLLSSDFIIDNKPFIELAKTFKKIHTRLLSMGYNIQNGELIKIKNQ